MRTATILAIDDDSVSLKILETVLHAAGYLVDTASDAEEGLLKARQILPDLILIDKRMPGMCGDELCRKLKKDLLTSRIPAIFITSANKTHDIVSSFEAGASDYISKPVIREVLLARLRTHLSNYRMHQELTNRTHELSLTNARMQMYMKAVDASSHAVFITDNSGIILWVNQAFEKMTGFTRSQAIGQNPRIMNSGKQSGEHYRHLWQTICGGSVWSGRIVNRKANGDFYTVEQSITPVTNELGEIDSFIAIHNDISDYVDLLEDREQLNQSVKKLETMISAINHDIRSPISSIRTTIDLVCSIMDQDEGHQQLNEVLQNAKAQTEVLCENINDTLDMMKLSSGAVRWQWKKFDAAEIVETQIQILQSSSVASHPDLHFNIQHNVFLQGDPRAFRRVLMNLLSNALKFCPKNQILISLAKDNSNDSQYLRLTIKDCGPGISPERMKLLGEAYSCHYGLTDRESNEGAGIGLSICNSILAVHGGWLELHSIPGEGCMSVAVFKSDLEQAMDDSLPQPLIKTVNQSQ